ncbi:flagellar hook-basal body complex protein FliE [Geodermatophilus bullaregiensis]|uniref:flagellar hook-basal body complex protein FliE n=1 Tax=Geodermatophilus bullaregiensis TaxID=1564160 RepID=UPI0019578A77|nr:flagellar hook-basal body complex protein FliE [Geodermatophilus bullaregiensis]MBM7807456.1 flagellar hook-basal body complex protein FliE [Geodermatophilus bullaregiensis]
MTSPIGGVSLPGVPSIGALGGVGDATAAASAPSTTGDGFAATLAGAVDQLQGLQSTSSGLATAAATGDLKDVHDYMIAAQEASLATEVVVTLKNKAVEAFTEIMRMPI